MMQINKNPSPRDLRIFAALLPVVFGAAGAFRWQAGASRAAVTLWVIGLLLSLGAFLVPPARRWLYLGWTWATYPIAWMGSQVILIALFFAVVTPIAFVLRLLGRDPMQRQLNKAEKSYWVPREPNRGSARYFRQF